MEYLFQVTKRTYDYDQEKNKLNDLNMSSLLFVAANHIKNIKVLNSYKRKF